MTADPTIIGVDISAGGVWNSLFHDSLSGLLRYAVQRPSWELLFNDGPLKQRGLFSRYGDLAGLKARGLIVYGRLSDSRLVRVKALGIPVVSVQAGTDSAFPCVQTDFPLSGSMVAEHLIARAFTSLAFVGNLTIPSITGRYEGFAQMARQHGCLRAWLSVREKRDGVVVTNRSEAIRSGLVDEQATPRENNLSDWLAALPKPVGIMTSSDRRAQNVLMACRNLGLAIPDQVAIVGVENNRLICESTRPGISSVDVNGPRIGYEAARLLDSLIEGKASANAPVRVAPRGVVTRGSSDILAIDDRAVRAAVTFINRNLSRPIGVNDIVRASDISCTNLERRFRLNLDRTINAELLRQRLERSKQLMIETDLSLSQIAELSGFRYSYFRNVFARKTGEAPGQWREERV